MSNYTGKYHITENLQRRSLEFEYGFQIPSLNLNFAALFLNIAHFSSNLMKQAQKIHKWVEFFKCLIAGFAMI